MSAFEEEENHQKRVSDMQDKHRPFLPILLACGIVGTLGSCKPPVRRPDGTDRPSNTLVEGDSPKFGECRADGSQDLPISMELYVSGLNHHGPDEASGARESDLKNLAGAIKALASDPSNVVFIATGSNRRAPHENVVTFPADYTRLRLNEMWHTDLGVAVAGEGEFFVAFGSNWRISAAPERRSYPDNLTYAQGTQRGFGSYLFVELEHQLSHIRQPIYVVRFVPNYPSENPADQEIARRFRVGQARHVGCKMVLEHSRYATAPIMAGDFNSTDHVDDGIFDGYADCEAGPDNAGDSKVGIIEAIAPNWTWVNREQPCQGTLIFNPAPKISVAFARLDRLRQAKGSPVAQSFGVRLMPDGKLAPSSIYEGIITDGLTHNTTAIDISYEPCPEPSNVLCGGVCTPLGSSANCESCGDQCDGVRTCREGRCVRNDGDGTCRRSCQAGSSCHDGECKCDKANWFMCRDGNCRTGGYKCNPPE
jgi:hypothetical protein